MRWGPPELPRLPLPGLAALQMPPRWRTPSWQTWSFPFVGRRERGDSDQWSPDAFSSSSTQRRCQNMFLFEVYSTWLRWHTDAPAALLITAEAPVDVCTYGARIRLHFNCARCVET
mmetsp:Transcript_25972/g.74348  ORF Transcript_25972/g.74348 Transcript_25972/m.74348 type:complete len:116 (-) Transcript_25972:163-510(-)